MYEVIPGSDVTTNQIHNCDGISGMDRIPNKSVNLLITDPPYNISQRLNCKGQRLGTTAKLDFDFGEWDNDNQLEPNKWVGKALSKVGGWAIIFCAKRDIGTYWDALRNDGFRAVDAIVWKKPDPVPLNGKTKMLNAWETAVIGKRDGAYFGGYCTHNIFTYQAPKGKTRIHPTQKPLGLITELISLTTRAGDIVLDPFMGSGTTAVACVRLGRRYVGFEIDREYCMKAEARLVGEKTKISEQRNIYDYPTELGAPGSDRILQGGNFSKIAPT